MDHFGGRSSTCYTVVAAIKIVALLFMISVAVECIFYFRPCFWFLWGLLISLALFTITIIVKGAMYVFYYGLKIFMGSMKVAVYCLRSTTLFASDWALNLRIDLRSFSQLCCLCSIMIIVFHWNKHGARNVCDRVSSAVKEAKELFHSTFTVCNYHVRIIQGKLDRLSRRSSAGCVAAVFIKICVMFVVAAIVLKCVWVTIGNLFIICTCLFCSVVMVIFGDIRQILMNLDALFQNKPISFSKIFTGLSDGRICNRLPIDYLGVTDHLTALTSWLAPWRSKRPIDLLTAWLTHWLVDFVGKWLVRQATSRLNDLMTGWLIHSLRDWTTGCLTVLVNWLTQWETDWILFHLMSD